MTVYAVRVIFESGSEEFALFELKSDAEREVDILKGYSTVKDVRIEEKRVY